MEELIKAYKAEIELAKRNMKVWKDHPLQYNVAEQQKTSYERVVDDLEEYLKSNGVLHSVSVSSGVSDLDFKAACHWYNMILSHIESGKDDMSVVDEITKELKANFKRR